MADTKRSSTSSTEHSDVDTDRVHRETQVVQLARQITQSSLNGPAANPFQGDIEDPELDPLSKQFSTKKWMRNLLSLNQRDSSHIGRAAGVSFKGLNVYGFGHPTDFQKSVGNIVFSMASSLKSKLGFGKENVRRIEILRDFEGLVKPGEMLVVLGRPGSGCSTFLKTISGDTFGFFVDESSDVQYSGISPETMHHDFRGEVIYNAEVEVHFPNLTVGETLEFAAKARAPRNRFGGATREQYATHMRDVVMAAYGLSHTINTRVGNDFLRGVSGGERKRVSIAEATLCFAPVQCWDNSTRGLDSATALEFIKTLRLQSEYTGSTSLTAIYQASQSAYDSPFGNRGGARATIAEVGGARAVPLP